MFGLILVLIGVIGFIGCFVSLLVNNIIYLKTVRGLLKYLKEQHSEQIKDWGLPDSLMDASPKRVPRLLNFLKSSEDFDDSTLKSIKEKAQRHLRLGYILFACGAGFFVIIFISAALISK